MCVSHKGLWLSIQNEDHIHVYTIVTPAGVSSQAVDEICGLDAFVSDLKSKIFVQNLKLNASRHVLAWKQVHLSAVVVYCVHYQISHESACRGTCVCVRRGIEKKTRLSLTVLISVITPHLQVFSPDLWRTVNSYQAVSLSPSPSLSPMSYFSAAAEQSHASSDSSCRVTSAGGDVWHTRPLMVRIHIQQGAARDRCTFTQKPSSFTVILCVIYVEEWLQI